MIHAPQEKILVISQTMPRPDMHSGSLRLFTMLEIMAKKWQVVLVISFGSNPGDEPYISTTSVGAQGMGLVDRRNVLIADSADPFDAAVVELLTDAALHQMIRSNALDLIENNYTPARVEKRLLDSLAIIGSQPVKKIKIAEKLLFFKDNFPTWVRARLPTSKDGG